MLHNDPQKDEDRKLKLVAREIDRRRFSHSRHLLCDTLWTRKGKEKSLEHSVAFKEHSLALREHSENIHGTFIADSTGSAACTMKPSLTTRCKFARREPSQESFENFALSFLLLFSVGVRIVLSSK